MVTTYIAERDDTFRKEWEWQKQGTTMPPTLAPLKLLSDGTPDVDCDLISIRVESPSYVFP
jgi:hypothetical protein